jgi:hypothetical protein
MGWLYMADMRFDVGRVLAVTGGVKIRQTLVGFVVKS